MTQRWMLSWSDFVTLLLVVFAAMYANARSAPASLLAARDSAVPATAQKSDDAHPEAEAVAALAAAFDEVLWMQDARQIGVQVIPMKNGVLLDLAAPLLFGSGDAELSPEFLPMLESLATVLKTRPYSVVIEGYADARPINTYRFPSNWELSAARAASVARFFSNREVSEERIEVIGKGAGLAASANDTADRWRWDRRVRILVRISRLDSGE